MRCEELDGLLAGLVAGDLSPAQEEFVRLHLRECQQCQTTYAGLIRTQRQLAGLADGYRPELTGRITRAIDRRRTGRSLLRFMERGLQAAGALALMILVIGAVLWQRLPLAHPAAPAPTPAYLLAGAELLYVEAPGRSARPVARVGAETVPFPGGVIRSGERVSLVETGDGVKLKELPTPFPQDAIFLRTPAGLWSIRQESESGRILTERVDPVSGVVEPDPHPKEGKAYKAISSLDGRQLYLLAEVGEAWFVKAIDAETRTLANAHRLTAGFGATSALLLSPTGESLYVVDRDRLMAIDLAHSTIALDQALPGLGPEATLSPKGDRILSVRPDGGLTLVDTESGRIVRQSAGQRYEQVAWKGPWAYGLRSGGLDLIDPVRLEVKATTSLPSPARFLALP